MSFISGEIIDNRFKVEDICSNNGGMGEILFITDLTGKLSGKLVLKYCKKVNTDILHRFKREVRLMKDLNNNPKIISILNSNTEYTKPYYIMNYYKNGDLTNIIGKLQNDLELQERIFCSMIDCIQELHSINIYHRDIKPENFLITDDDQIIVSDLGLGVEINSSTRITNTDTALGTIGYYPPEFTSGGFKYMDNKSDIYMLGKSFYYLLTGMNPAQMDSSSIEPSLMYIINKSCSFKKEDRYNSLSELKKSLQLVYDILLNRGNNQYIKAIELLDDIQKKHNNKSIVEFLTILFVLDEEDQVKICINLKEYFFTALNQYIDTLEIYNFLKIYKLMVLRFDYMQNQDYTVVDSIGHNLNILLISPDIDNTIKSYSLDLMITVADSYRRFYIQDLCMNFIYSIKSEELGNIIVPTILNNKDTFLSTMEVSKANESIIMQTINNIQ